LTYLKNFKDRHSIILGSQLANLNYGCGFGQGVFADGYYKKVSARVPEIEAEE
jgi:hypothetical protein